jgi:hypothetical protein
MSKGTEFVHRSRPRATPRGRRLWAAAAAMMLAIAAISLGLSERTAFAAETDARFVITDQVINPRIPAISATIGGFGNGGAGNGNRFVADSGFEPYVFRTAFQADRGAPDRVIANDYVLSQWDTLRPGALDGAALRIYRIENGTMRLVRRDRVAKGGHTAGDWSPVQGGNQALPATVTAAPLAWERWYRPDAETWFMVRAVDARGRLSPPSEARMARSPGLGDRAGWKGPQPFDQLAALFKKVPKRMTQAAGGPAAPQDVAVRVGADGAPALSWRPAPDGPRPTGYVIYRAQTLPDPAETAHLILEGGATGESVRAGDLVILSKKFLGADREDFATDRVWDAGPGRRMRPKPVTFWPDPDRGLDWRLRPHAPDTPVEEPGESYLEMTLGAGAGVSLVGGYHGGLSESWYEVLEPRTYRMEAWVRSDRPSQVRFRLHGVYAGSVRPTTFATGPQWRKITTDFTITRAEKEGRGSFRLDFDGAGRFGLDNFRIFRADAAFLDFLPEDYAHLKTAAPSALRTHSLIKTGVTTYDLEQLTNPGGVASGPTGGATLPQQLGLVAKAHADAWIQIEPHLSPEEWLGLVDYLAAPADAGHPWAMKRARQGRPTPWTDAFGRIYFEIGNETWNGLFRPWVFPDMQDAVTDARYSRGEVYGLFQRHVIEILRSSPAWNAAGLDDKVTFVLGGWIVNDYGQQAAKRSSRSALVGIAPYIGGWDANEGLPSQTPEDYFNLLNWVSRSTIPFARKQMEWAEGLTRADGSALEVGVYEGGPGFVQRVNGRGLSAEEALTQERVMKGQAAGVATLDSFLAMFEAGFRMQNFFTFGAGERWASHAEWQNGGQAYPSWKLTGLLNREGLGDMLKVETRSVPRADLAKTARREAVDDAALVGVYATRDGDRLNLFVLSRRAPGWPATKDDGCTPVEIALPFASADKVTLHRMTGPYDADNVDADRVGIETVALPTPTDPSRFTVSGATGAQACGLPAATALLYVFEGVKGAR